jgi:hypothetical protein
MGNVVFTPCSGAVEIARPNCPATQVLTIDIDGPVTAIVTGMTLEMSGNYQFLHTLNDLVYFYSFGDRVGTLTLTGLGFMAACPGSAKGSVMKMYDYYMEKRASKSDGIALNIVLTADSKSIKLWGFLTGMRLDISDSQMGTVGYWSMRFEVLPQK